MSSPISKITLNNFRGASQPTTIELDPKKMIVMFFGENGTGKSCIVDSLDMVANESPGSLGERSSTGVGHLPTIGRTAGDLSVTVAAGADSWTGTLRGRKIVVAGAGRRPKIHILRRSQLLKLIEAQPAQRYDELRGFIDVAAVERAEQTLREAVAGVNGELTRASESLIEANTALVELWKKEGSPAPGAEAWAKKKSGADPTARRAEVEALSTLIQQADAVRQALALLDESDTDVEEKEAALRTVQKDIDAAPGANAEDAIGLMELLSRADPFLAPPKQATSCPVCEQLVNAASLRQSIAQRLSNMKAFQELAGRRASATRARDGAVGANERLAKSFAKAASVAFEGIKACTVKAVGESIRWQDYVAIADTKADLNSKVGTSRKLASALLPLIDTLASLRDAASADCDQYNAIKGYYDRIGAARESGKQLEALSQRITKALAVVHEHRINYTQGILNSISSECNRLYTSIHPSEPLGDSALVIDPERRASLLQQASFAGHAGVPPQAYFSESHLDTLGFCVWLAIAKLRSAKEAVIVLDDVFTSVDSVHMTRIVDLLSAECSSFCQMIITTHYRNWRDRYRLPGGSSNVQLLELHRWSLARGVSITSTKLAVADLKAAVETVPLDRQAVGSRAGILLESLLYGLALQYRCRVALTRDGDYTLQELLDGCASLFKKLEIVAPAMDVVPAADGSRPTLKTAIKPLVEAVTKLGLIRNQVGCHFNLAGTDIADGDVEAFGIATMALVQGICCPLCGEIARRNKGACFECRCGKTTMRPLEVT